MENPFEIILEKLESIESLLSEMNALPISNPNPTNAKTILNMNELSEYLGLSKGTLYKFTSERKIPHYKRGKYIYFLEDEIIEWIKEGRIKTMDEIEEEASNYLLRNKR